MRPVGKSGGKVAARLCLTEANDSRFMDFVFKGTPLPLMMSAMSKVIHFKAGKEFRYLSGIPARRVHQQIAEYSSVPSAEGFPGIRTPWGNEFSPMD